MIVLGFICLVVWLFMATGGTNILTATFVLVIGLVLIFVGALVGIADGAPTAEDLEKVAPKNEPPSRQWRWHDSKGEATCTGCDATITGGYWAPWQYDALYGSFHNRSDHYCEPCADFRQEAERLGTEGVTAMYAEGRLSEEARDEMLNYLVELENP